MLLLSLSYYYYTIIITITIIIIPPGHYLSRCTNFVTPSLYTSIARLVTSRNANVLKRETFKIQRNKFHAGL